MSEADTRRGAGRWAERAVALLVCCLALSVVLLVGPPDAQRPGPPAVLELGDPLPAGTALRTVETARAPIEIDENAARFMDLFEREWQRLVSQPQTPTERQAFGNFDEIFMRSGRYLRFVQILEHIQRSVSLVSSVAERLPEPMASALRIRAARLHALGPFLVWGRWQIGAADAAEALSGELVERLPNNPDAHMVRALMVDQSGAGTARDLKALRRHMQRVVELDPQYRGFGLDAATLRRQLEALDARLGGQPSP